MTCRLGCVYLGVASNWVALVDRDNLTDKEVSPRRQFITLDKDFQVGRQLRKSKRGLLAG